MKQIEKEVNELLVEVMSHCKSERKTKTKVTNKELAAKLEITDNFLVAVESGRAVPSIKLFLKYLLHLGFDIKTLKSIKIMGKRNLSPVGKVRTVVTSKINTLDEEQLGYLLEQIRIIEMFDMRVKGKRK